MEQENKDRELTRFLVFSVSQRKGSLNTKLAQLAAGVIENHGGVVDFAGMTEFDARSFNQDLEINDFHPKGAEEFRKRLLANDAFIISSPEYNGSMPGLIKNSIDWVSRFRPQPFNEKHALLMSASPSMAGGNRGFWHCECRWNIWVQMFFRICFHLQWLTRHSMIMGILQMKHWQKI